ncbi:imidazole glycerol phosphate synthase subunit HisH [Bacillota bacterium LX-D]|nr:imidazole glycerol phosphate synthase subunit HisH [Bacillota bacterium LX-D]
MIAIIDYGMGNLRSVQKGLESVGCEAYITNNPAEILQAKGVVLPGVGAFADAMKSLKGHNLLEVITEVVESKKPLLGICLGMQLLFEYSEENGCYKGLGIFKGGVKKLPAGLKVPHMGWNQLAIEQETPILEGIKSGSSYYFVHSYHVIPAEPDVILATTDYGQDVVAIVGRENVFGIQFHPEKSSTNGLKILKNYGELVQQC